MTAYERWGKRALDVTASAAGLLALSPFFFLTAALIKVLDPGPVFFRQIRAGRGFKPFKIYKFRSMRMNAGKGPQITSDGDPRVTPLGRFLRKTKLDELPQLFNVLLGDMSLVGPRPTVPKYAEMFRAQYEEILSVRPGITDWASIRFRDEEGVLRGYDEPEAGYMDDILPEKMELYRRYIKEVGLLSDLRILWATALKVARRGAEDASAVLIRPLTPRDRRLAMLSLDLLAVLGAYALAFDLLGNGRHRGLSVSAPYAALAYLAASYYFGVNRGLRYYASYGDVWDTFKATACAAVLQSAVLLVIPGLPWRVLALWPILALIGVAGLHAFTRAARHHLNVQLHGGRKRQAVIIGVGDLAELTYQNMRAHETLDYRVAAFLDDGASRCGVRLHGAPVIAGSAVLRQVVERRGVEEVVVAVPPERRAAALSVLGEALQGLPRRPDVLVMPSLEEMRRTETAVQPRSVQPADLLARRAAVLDGEAIGAFLGGKTVLITGAGGFIGGELARQAARYKPRKLLLLDNHATALFCIESELRQSPGDVELQAVLGDVRDQSLLDRLFQDEKPQVIFHAAAHKHLYQLELNVQEGVSNNLLATYQLAAAAARSGAEAFLFVSTDKAARPDNVMGATKRAAELVLCAMSRPGGTRFSSVRFGNVLGSAGSMLKIFQEQIEKGRPLTLTHPEAARYFMTVEEAGGLILQAAALARGGEVFSLKLGEQIRVMDLARSLVRLSGLDPDKDVGIRVVGLRPGETPADDAPQEILGLTQTGHPGIMALPSDGPRLDVLSELEMLGHAAAKDALIRILTQLRPSPGAPDLSPN